MVPLGVSLFAGRHDNDNIMRWVVGRLRQIGLAEDDLCSTATDSGSNMEQTMGRLPAP